MRRREVVHGLLAVYAATSVFAAKAQGKAKVRRIGYLSLGPPRTFEDIYAALEKFGWIEGHNLSVTQRYANERVEMLPALAEELVRLKAELIVTDGTMATLAARTATRTVPIVFWSAGDPVGAGLVTSLARPAGNVTGYTTAQPQVDAKRLELLHDLLPSVQRVGVLETSSNPYYRVARENLRHAASALGIQLIFVDVSKADPIEAAVAEVARRGGQALLVGPDNLFTERRAELMQAALKNSLPTTVSRLYIRELGALISYAPIEAEHDARAAAFVDRILRGAKPADLPVEQPSRFALVINLRTARALGIDVPRSLLLRADELIQ